jgi:hypothetical protein
MQVWRNWYTRLDLGSNFCVVRVLLLQSFFCCELIAQWSEQPLITGWLRVQVLLSSLEAYENCHFRI